MNDVNGFFEPIERGVADRVRSFVASTPDAVYIRQEGATPLHVAAILNHREIVELVLEHGADPDLGNSDGQTALAVAPKQVESGCKGTPVVIESRRQGIEAGCEKVVELLCKHGARG